MKFKQIIEQVLDQIVEDVEIGDLTAIEELLRNVPVEQLLAYLPEDLSDKSVDFVSN